MFLHAVAIGLRPLGETHTQETQCDNRYSGPSPIGNQSLSDQTRGKAAHDEFHARYQYLGRRCRHVHQTGPPQSAVAQIEESRNDRFEIPGNVLDPRGGSFGFFSESRLGALAHQLGARGNGAFFLVYLEGHLARLVNRRRTFDFRGIVLGCSWKREGINVLEGAMSRVSLMMSRVNNIDLLRYGFFGWQLLGLDCNVDKVD
mmetsp:Transcript_15241/g.38390  ORF Transcript_15241/g.38390 Transcript_15241/m.38390 type:complete len:202 (-) Transcript_15241:111-716(-)